mmetsp:Transcript_27046/g.65245  ORF Transcript_27046/g.65245 Transcript_27046/m.65245 type:complete len:97 (-) Transcript_27046:475-765(-)
MQPLLDSSQIMYALVRLTQLVDRSTTVKFAFISWVGDDVAPMRKAKLSTLRGEAASILAPVHTEVRPCMSCRCSILMILEARRAFAAAVAQRDIRG